MKKLTALLLCFVLIAGVLAGCSKEETIVGTWSTDINMGKLIADEMGEEMATYLNFDGIQLKLTMTFNEDGTYTMTADKASATAMFDALKAEMKTGMTKYLEDSLMGTGVSVEDALAMTGMSMDDLIEQSFSADMIDEMLEEMSTDGEYELSDGKLFLDGDACDYTLDGDTLTLDSDEMEEIESLLPLVFKKA